LFCLFCAPLTRHSRLGIGRQGMRHIRVRVYRFVLNFH
jgi:hypothetical protein